MIFTNKIRENNPYIYIDIVILKSLYVLQPVDSATKRLHQPKTQTKQPRTIELTINKEQEIQRPNSD